MVTHTETEYCSVSGACRRRVNKVSGVVGELTLLANQQGHGNILYYQVTSHITHNAIYHTSGTCISRG